MHRNGVLATLLSSLAGTLAASCYSDRCLNRVNCGEGCVADCSRHLAVTVTPPAVTITSTVVIDSQLAANVSPNGPESTTVNAAQDCQAVAGFPYWAAVCDTKERFSSACSCIGASIITTATAPTPTSTVIETIVTSPSILSLLRSSSSSVPTSTGSSLLTATASFIPSPTVALSTVLLPTSTGGPSSSTGQSGPSATTDNVPVLLTVVPAIPGPPSNRKRRLGGKGAKRQNLNGGTLFNITTEGQLTSDGRVVATRFGDVFIPLAPSDDEGEISKAFVVINSVLHWQNTAFDGGEAGFCQVVGSGQVYATFAERATWPPGCDSISIIVYKARQCRNGVIVPEVPGDVISTVPSTAGTETESSSIFIDNDFTTSLDGTSSTIDPGQSMETSIPAGTAGTTVAQSFASTQVSNATPTTSTSQILSVASDLSPTSTPRSPELSSSSMSISQSPFSTESFTTPSISISGEETGVTASPTSVEGSASPSSPLNGPHTLGSLTSAMSSSNIVTSPSSDSSTEVPTQASTTGSTSSTPGSLGPTLSTEYTSTYIGSTQSSDLVSTSSSATSPSMSADISPITSSTSVPFEAMPTSTSSMAISSASSSTFVVVSTSSITSVTILTTSSKTNSEIVSASESQTTASMSTTETSETASSSSVSSMPSKSEEMTTPSPTVSETYSSSSTESLISSSYTLSVSSTSPSYSDLQSTTEITTPSSSSSSSSASASASANPKRPQLLPRSRLKQKYRPAALWDLDLTTGRLVLSSSVSSAPPIAPVLLPAHSVNAWVQLAGTNSIDNDPNTFAEMTCFVPAGSSGTATDPVTGNLVSGAPLDCMATATDTGRHYGQGFAGAGGRELYIIGDQYQYRGFQFKVGFGDTCDPPI
ncbi:hypothetical protein PG984_003936 [Apiospora sp. TS-2023a]